MIRNVIFVSQGNLNAIFHSGKFSIDQNFFDLVHAHLLISIAKKKISSQNPCVRHEKNCSKIIVRKTLSLKTLHRKL